MANTYYQIYIQLVFAVYRRQNMIPEKHRDEIEKYMCGIVKNKKVKPLAIYCNPDHCHLFVAPPPSIAISKLVQDVKSNTTNFINSRLHMGGAFSWQNGFGAFSYGKSQVETVYNYVLNQHEHHKGETFKKEYLEFLKRFDVDYKDQYLFEWYD